MLGKMFGGLEEYAPLFIRLGLATIFFHSGSQKVFGMFGGMGLEATADSFKTKLDFPLPMLMASLAGIGELGGGILVGIGLITRYAAGTLCIIMIVAIFAAHHAQVFGEGRAAFACLIMAISLLATGGGKASADRMLKIDERV
ncbi:MAG TPA: DoxX family protein [Planctomycetota bacterium]|nr:DoxX family protein [Planctomycetota bacterium]